MLGVSILHYRQVLLQNLMECFDGSEVTGKGNDSIAQKQNCVVEEIKEVELRSRHGKFIYNRTYNSVSLCKLGLTAPVLAQSVERVDSRAGGRGFDSRGRTNTQGLKITEK